MSDSSSSESTGSSPELDLAGWPANSGMGSREFNDMSMVVSATATTTTASMVDRKPEMELELAPELQAPRASGHPNRRDGGVAESRSQSCPSLAMAG